MIFYSWLGLLLAFAYLVPLAVFDNKYHKVPKELFMFWTLLAVFALPFLYISYLVISIVLLTTVMVGAVVWIMLVFLPKQLRFLAPADVVALAVVFMLGGGIAAFATLLLAFGMYLYATKWRNHTAFPFITGMAYCLALIIGLLACFAIAL